MQGQVAHPALAKDSFVLLSQPPNEFLENALCFLYEKPTLSLKELVASGQSLLE